MQQLPNLEKLITVGFLLVFWLALDLLKINDDNLKYTCAGLIALVTSWGGITNLPFTVKKGA